MPDEALVLDPEHARRAFEALRPTLEAMKPSEQVVPRLDLTRTALFLLKIARTLKETDINAALAVLPEVVWPADMAMRLEEASWALWYIETEYEAEAVKRPTRQVPVALLDDAAVLRAQMLKVAEYHLADDGEASATLTAIRQGSGYTDLARDLSLLASVFERWGDTLERDTRFFNPDMAPGARRLAGAILDALTTPTTATSAVRPQTYGLALALYAHCQAAAGLVFLNDPATQARFPSIVTSVRKPRSKRKPEPTEG